MSISSDVTVTYGRCRVRIAVTTRGRVYRPAIKKVASFEKDEAKILKRVSGLGTLLALPGCGLNVRSSLVSARVEEGEIEPAD